MGREKRPEGTTGTTVVIKDDDVFRKRQRCIHYIKRNKSCYFYKRKCCDVPHCDGYCEKQDTPSPKPTEQPLKDSPKPQPTTVIRPLITQLVRINARVLHCPKDQTQNSFGVGTVLQLMVPHEAFRVRFDSGTIKAFTLSALTEGRIRVLDQEDT